MSAFAREPKPIYHNLGGGVFDVNSAQMGFRESAAPSLTFGGKWLDYDNDGCLDLVLACGHIRDTAEEYGGSFLQLTLLIHNAQGHQLENRSSEAGGDLARPILGCGLQPATSAMTTKWMCSW